MNILEIKDAVLIGIFLAFTLGPVFFMLIETSISRGFRAALAFDLGVVLADIAFFSIAYFGSRSILFEIKDHPLIYVFGGIIMTAYGIYTFYNKKQTDVIADEKLVIKTKYTYFQLFINGFFLNFINIGVLGFWLGMILIFGARLDMNEEKILLFFGTILSTYFIVDLGKILLAKRLSKNMTPSLIYKTKRILGIILIIFGILLMFNGFIPNDRMPLEKVIEKRLDTNS